jgi:hypothetical protein
MVGSVSEGVNENNWLAAKAAIWALARREALRAYSVAKAADEREARLKCLLRELAQWLPLS